MALRAFPVTYASDVEAVASFWELLGFRRHVQLPPEGEPGYIGLTRDGAGEAPSYGRVVGRRSIRADPWHRASLRDVRLRRRPPGMLARLTQTQVLREAEDTPWGERIAAVADPEGNPVALCQTR
jgi:lactoylglutathione lyase